MQNHSGKPSYNHKPPLKITSKLEIKFGPNLLLQSIKVITERTMEEVFDNEIRYKENLDSFSSFLENLFESAIARTKHFCQWKVFCSKILRRARITIYYEMPDEIDNSIIVIKPDKPKEIISEAVIREMIFLMEKNNVTNAFVFVKGQLTNQACKLLKRQHTSMLRYIEDVW